LFAGVRVLAMKRKRFGDGCRRRGVFAFFHLV
jgi:hypothetical protein